MSPHFAQKTISKAIIACGFVFLASIGFSGKASASCGDYLRHHASRLSHNFSMSDGREDGHSSKSHVPSTSCRNGRCGEAPPALPFDSVRIAKLDANHVRMEFFFEFGFKDKFESTDDKSPLQPTLDLSDPPPRDLAL